MALSEIQSSRGILCFYLLNLVSPIQKAFQEQVVGVGCRKTTERNIETPGAGARGIL